MFEEQPQMTEEMWLHGTPFSLNDPGRYFNMVAVRDFTTDPAGKEKYVVVNRLVDSLREPLMRQNQVLSDRYKLRKERLGLQMLCPQSALRNA
jgi:hypothetical protein